MNDLNEYLEYRANLQRMYEKAVKKHRDELNKKGLYVYSLVKMYNKKEYAEDLLSGKVFIHQLGYYIDSEMDPDEGTGLAKVDDKTKLTINDKPIDNDNIIGNIELRTDEDLTTYVFCLSSIDGIHFSKVENVQEFRKQLELDPKCIDYFGHHAVHIHHSGVFIDRLIASAKKKGFNLVGYGPVTYYNPSDPPDNMYFSPLTIFHKKDVFEHENEYRIAITKNDGIDQVQEGQDYVVLDIGDIRDIASYIDARDFNDRIEIKKKI